VRGELIAAAQVFVGPFFKLAELGSATATSLRVRVLLAQHAYHYRSIEFDEKGEIATVR
jgi:hypothetical protein